MEIHSFHNPYVPEPQKTPNSLIVRLARSVVAQTFRRAHLTQSEVARLREVKTGEALAKTVSSIVRERLNEANRQERPVLPEHEMAEVLGSVYWSCEMKLTEFQQLVNQTFNNICPLQLSKSEEEEKATELLHSWYMMSIQSARKSEDPVVSQRSRDCIGICMAMASKCLFGSVANIHSVSGRDGQVEGMMFVDLSNPRVVIIDHLVTHPKNICPLPGETVVRGAGTALFNKACDIAKESGRQHVCFQATKSAVGFYEKNGCINRGLTTDGLYYNMIKEV